MKEIIYCRECDHRYEMLDGTMDCMWFECLTVEPDDFCAWGEYGEGTKERQRTKEEEFQRWLDSNPKVMASSATILTEADLERMKEALAAMRSWRISTQAQTNYKTTTAPTAERQ